MKKLKIFLPSIALIVVLAFSITIGVFAAQNTSLTINSTISFISPDIDATIYCFVGGASDDLAAAHHVWNSTDENRTDWNLGAEEDFKFTTEKDSAIIAPITLSFVIENNTEGLPIYSYFSDTATGPQIRSSSVDGNNKDDKGAVINSNLLSFNFSGQKEHAKKGEAGATQTLTMDISMRNIIRADSATFNYHIILSKYMTSGEVSTTGEEQITFDSSKVESLDNVIIKGNSENYKGNLFNSKAIKEEAIAVSADGRTITMPEGTGNGHTLVGSKLSELCPDLKVGDLAWLSFTTTSQFNKYIYLSSVKYLWKSGECRIITQEDLNSPVALYGNSYVNEETGQIVISDFKIEKNKLTSGYVPYSGAPDTVNPLEIQSIGDKTANVFDINDLSYPSNANYSISGNTITLTDPPSKYLSAVANIHVEAGIPYYISAIIESPEDSGHIAIDCMNSDDEVIKSNVIIFNLAHSGTIRSFTPVEDTAYLKVSIRNRYTYGFSMSNIMITSDGSQEGYEPYGYKVDVLQRGKNILSEVVSGYPEVATFPTLTETTSTVYKTAILRNVKAGVYTFSFEKPVIIVRSMTTSNHSEQLNIKIVGDLKYNVKTVTIAVINDEAELHLSFKDVSSQDWGTAWVQCEKGMDATSYEEYVESQTITVYLDEPLRRIGKYADYIDLKNKKVVRVIKETNLVASSVSSTGTNDGSLLRFYMSANDRKTAENVTDITVLSNKLLAVSREDYTSSVTQSIESIAGNTSNGAIFFKIRSEVIGGTTITDCNTYLNNNPILVSYVLSDSIEQSIDVPDLSLMGGCSIIEVQTSFAPSELYVSYTNNIA